MPPKAIKKKSSLKKQTPRGARRATSTGQLAEEEVLASRDFLRQIIDINPHFIFAKDRDGRFTLANQAVADCYGTTIEGLIGKTDADFNPNNTEIEFFLKMDREVMDSKKERFIPEEVITDVAGKTRWLQTIKRPIIGKDGRANQVLGVSIDITERKQAEEALRESEQRFRVIYDQTYEFIGLLTPDGTLIDVNQTALAFRGLQRPDVVGKLFWETPWWDLSRELQEKLKVAIAQAAAGTFVRLRAQHRSQAGAIEEIDFSLTPITDRTGKVIQIIPEGRRITTLTKMQEQLRQAYEELEQRVVERTDELKRSNESLQMEILERKQAVAMLRERETLSAAFLDNSATVAWMKDTEGRHVYLSPNYERRFGIRFEDWRGKTDFELWPREVAEQLRRNDLAVLQRNTVGEVVEEVKSIDGSLSWWLNHKFPYRDASGKRYVGGLGVEITERKQAEEALHQKQRELQTSQAQLQDLASKLLTAQDSERQRIARDLHDDFSQRLAALVLEVASLQRQPPLLPKLIGKALEPVREELTQLSEDLHNLAYRLHPSLLRHAGMQPAIEDHIQKAIERTGLHIVLKVKNLPGSIPHDWSICLFRLFQECLQNVVKHANATEVLVKLSGSSKGIGLSVIDNGKGFDASDKSGQQEGLGLISMQERLRLVNGFLHISSRPADGTKVCAWIPFQEQTS